MFAISLSSIIYKNNKCESTNSKDYITVYKRKEDNKKHLQHNAYYLLDNSIEDVNVLNNCSF